MRLIMITYVLPLGAEALSLGKEVKLTWKLIVYSPTAHFCFHVHLYLFYCFYIGSIMKISLGVNEG